MDYRKVLVHGETEDQIDVENNRYLEVRGEAGEIVLHGENDELYLVTRLDVAEALALIAALTEAVASQL